ncbi:hypothetical protein niasHS_007062 [Heterodera schachtii]|uniref:G-protein coupled receptors family 1 profile domain-containing protein n=1 Tax=Heterodera schachtii TaxID=97005 RepID=A0ABD2JFF2_HETSC
MGTEEQDEAGFVFIEIAISVVITLICFFGIALNASLVYVTVKSKLLRSKCNVLIALYAFFAVFIHIGFCVKIVIFIFGINFITLGTCFWVQFISRSACVMAIILQLCIGVERLMAVSFPIWYNMSGKYSVFKVLITICLIKVIVDKCVDYYGSSKHWEKLVRCELSDPANQPEIIDYTVYNMLIIVVAEVLCYAMLWLISWWRKGNYMLPICLRLVQFECIYAFAHCSSRWLCVLFVGPLQQCASSFHYQFSVPSSVSIRTLLA